MKEEEVFWTFIAFTKDTLKHDPLHIDGADGLYNDKFPKMDFLMKCFDNAFARNVGDLKKYLDEIAFPNMLWVYKWIFILFLLSFPFAYCLRFWDYIFGYGLSGILRLSLGIVALTKNELKDKDFTYINTFMTSFKNGRNLPSAEEIIEAAERIDLDASILPGNNVPQEEDELMGDVEDEPKIMSMHAKMHSNE
eukprot:TRINITY_DN8180_c0_g2_i1.p1 TRINITY_DN8180_c0_g2~~TRINITY_DN8180_c0_g2_i1.p1  ORF type:complete len:194 (-),score=48.98 TRINITY_DN8180_c0_g2_i1:127-708(-)